MSTLFVDFEIELKVKMKTVTAILCLNDIHDKLPDDIKNKSLRDIERYISVHIDDFSEYTSELDKLYENFEGNHIINMDDIEEVEIDKLEVCTSIQ